MNNKVTLSIINDLDFLKKYTNRYIFSDSGGEKIFKCMCPPFFNKKMESQPSLAVNSRCKLNPDGSIDENSIGYDLEAWEKNSDGEEHLKISFKKEIPIRIQFRRKFL